jgi:sulfate adenylyltransferase
MNRPHGGKLINRELSAKEKERAKNEYKEMPQLQISDEAVEDLHNIAYGVYSPLEGFLVKEEVESIVKNDRLPDDTPWTIPILLDARKEQIEEKKEGDEIALVNNGDLHGILHLDEIYQIDKKALCRSIYQTDDSNHPGVCKTLGANPYYLGGSIDLVNGEVQKYSKYTLYPIETRVLFEQKNWKNIVGFQTRNVPHLGHEYLQKTALTFVDGLFINPIIGKKKTNDFLDNVILKAYETLLQHYYLKEKATMAILRTRMRYAGPKEAIFHAIVRKNFGCTHFIVGRDHAGVGNYYGRYDAQKIFDDFPDLDIEPVFFKSFYHCSKCGGIVSEGICPHTTGGYRTIISGSKIRKSLNEKKPENIKGLMRPEVIQVLLDQDDLFVKKGD